MTRKRHSDEPAKKKASKKSGKKASKKVAGKSLLERAAAKKRTATAASKIAPKLAPPSKDKRLAAEVVLAQDGAHPVDTLARTKAKSRRAGPQNPRSPIDDERAEFRSGPLTEEIIADVCRMLRFSLHRETVERLLGLSRGRIKKWIRYGKESREKIEAWHDSHDELVQGGKTSAAAIKEIGPQPDFDMYALFHACVLSAEANGEKTALAAIIDAAQGGYVTSSNATGQTETAPDWKAQAWLLSRRYNKRWGSFAQREGAEEEDQVEGAEGKQRSAVDRLADTLDQMFGKRDESGDV